MTFTTENLFALGFSPRPGMERNLGDRSSSIVSTLLAYFEVTLDLELVRLVLCRRHFPGTRVGRARTRTAERLIDIKLDLGDAPPAAAVGAVDDRAKATVGAVYERALLVGSTKYARS